MRVYYCYSGRCPLIASRGVIERLEQLLNHSMQLLGANLLLCRIVLEGFSGLLPACSRLEWRLLQQQFLEIVRSIKICLIARGYEDGWNLFALQCAEIDGSEEGVVDERLESNGAYALLAVLLQQRADGVQARHAHRRAGNGISGFSLEDLGGEGIMTAGFKGPLVVYALVEEHAERPPVNFARVSLSFVHFGREIGEGTGLACQGLVRDKVGGDVLGERLVRARVGGGCNQAYKVSQMDVSLRVQQHIVGLDIPMDNALLVDVAHGAA